MTAVVVWGMGLLGVTLLSIATAAEVIDRTDGGTDRDMTVVRLLGVACVAALCSAGSARAGMPAWAVNVGAPVAMLVIVGGARRFMAGVAAPSARRSGGPSMIAAIAQAGIHPVRALDATVDRWLSALLAITAPSHAPREGTAEQFRAAVRHEAVGSREQRALLLGAVDIGETTAAEVMTPRVDIVGVAYDTPWSELLDRMRAAQHSRVPVYRESIDDVTGIIYTKDLLAAVIADAEPEPTWTAQLRPPLFIPPAKRIVDLLREFRATGCHLAIVVDEFGGTAGLVTIEDVLEELVGEIRDEFDTEERQVESEGEDRFWVSGQLTLDDVSDALGFDFRRDDITTIGGLIMEVVGRVPRAGEALEIGPFRVIVERVVRRKVARIYFERRSAEMETAS